jgi:glycosyltransferase involved in cell wall biosynthesis
VALCKYLPQHGYQSDVLTVKSVAARVREPELLDEIKSTRIYRAGSYDPHRLLYLFGIKKVRESDAHRGKKATGRFFPDSQVGWVRPAITLGRTLAGSNHYDVILSTSPPISNHLVAKQLSVELRIPWIADFRDFWTRLRAEQSYADRRQIDRALRLLQDITTSAAAITAASSSIAKYLNTDTVLYNSCDDDLAALWETPERTGRFTIGLLGTLNEICPIHPLLEMLKLIKHEHPKLYGKLRVVQVGQVDREWLRKQLERHEMTDCFEINGFLPRNRSIQVLNDSSMLFLSLGYADDKGVIPGRLFTMLSSGRPILAAVPPESDVEQLLARTNSGRTFWGAPVTAGAQYILEQAESFLAGNLHISPRPEYSRVFTSSNLARQCASLCDRILSR